jgi:hypothetical protein
MTDDVFEELDDQVRKFTSTNLERGGVVTGWVLFVASSRIDDDGEMCWAYDYSVGPDTDLMRAVGLVKMGTAAMDRHLAGEGDDSE